MLFEDLDLALRLLKGPNPRDGILHFTRVATRQWHRSSAADWEAFCQATDRIGLLTLLRDDPITARCYRKPRGYPGDAELLDLIYDHDGANSRAVALTDSGPAAVNAVGYDSPEMLAVRRRRDHIAQVIDLLVDTRSDAQILSVAAGHCRELEVTRAAIDGTMHPITIVDHDPRSLEEAVRSYGDMVRPVESDVSGVIRGSLGSRQFDLIYSLGLYDYLPSGPAIALTQSLLGSLAPGGTLLLANFTPYPASIGYMESAMDWSLIYRDETQLAAVIDPALSPGDRLRTYRDPDGVVVYAAVDRSNE